MVLTLCDRCLEPFLDDKNYIVKRTKRTEDDEHDPHVGSVTYAPGGVTTMTWRRNQGQRKTNVSECGIVNLLQCRGSRPFRAAGLSARDTGVRNHRLAGCTGFVTTKPYFEQDHFREVAQMVKSHIVTSR